MIHVEVYEGGTGANINVPDDAWVKVDANGNILHAPPMLSINGVPLHVEAHEVVRSHGIQSAVGESEFEMLTVAHQLNAPQQETTINGRQYVIFASAYAE